MMRKLIAIGLILTLLLSGCRKEQPATTEPTTTEPITQPTTAPSTPETEATIPETEPPLTGWQEIDGQRVFYQEDGTLHTGWLEDAGHRYYLSENGSPLTGWLELDNQRYYMNEDGSMHIGWLEQDGARYYFNAEGIMAQGRIMISDEETRYFTSTGKEVILVNPWNFVPDDYEPELTTYQSWIVSAECADDLSQMLKDCKKAGFTAVVTSAYRTHSYQAGLYQRRIDRFVAQGYSRDKAEIEAAKRVAYPGTSEHELGLAVDIVDASDQNLTAQQETMPAQRWLIENSWRYGFILRYPNEKTDKTGIIYEPWHYRYVGKELAQELHGTDLCLEEYLEALTEE